MPSAARNLPVVIPVRVAVVGATGAVGSLLLNLLRKRHFPTSEVVPFASAANAGTVLADGTVVQELTVANVRGFDLALFSAGASVARAWAPAFAAAGALVVDNSSAWRMNPDVPLVVAEVNPEALASRPPRGISSNPNCVAMGALMALAPLHRMFGLNAVTLTSFQAAGGAGQRGIRELQNQVALLSGDPRLINDGASAADAITDTSVHGRPLAFNVVPTVGHLDDPHGYTDEELKLVEEPRKILGLPNLAVTPACVRVPVVVGHAVQIKATFDRRPNIHEAVTALQDFPGITLADNPTPLDFAGRDETAVGRLRLDLHDPQTLNLFVVSDNLRKGAALNTVQIAELLQHNGFLATAENGQ